MSKNVTETWQKLFQNLESNLTLIRATVDALIHIAVLIRSLHTDIDFEFAFRLRPIAPKRGVRAFCALKNDQKTDESKNNFFAQFLRFLVPPTLIRDHFGTQNGSPGTTF